MHVRHIDPVRRVGALVRPTRQQREAQDSALARALTGVAPRPDYHKKTAKLVRATDEQWAAWQREADKLTDGNLNAFMVEAAESRAASAKTMRLRNRHRAPK